MHPPQGSLIRGRWAWIVPGGAVGLAAVAAIVGSVLLDKSGVLGSVVGEEYARIVLAVLAGGVPGLAGLVVWVLFHRGVHGVVALRDALRAGCSGVTMIDEIRVDPAESPEARGFNEILTQLFALRARTSDMPAPHLDNPEELERRAAGSMLQPADLLWNGLLLFESSGVPLYSNTASWVLLGIAPPSDNRTIAADTLPIQVRGEVAKMLSESGPQRSVLHIEREIGGKIEATIRVTLKRTNTGGDAFVLGLVEDVTKQKTADAARNAFVEQAAHELRTPLTNVRLFVEEILDLDASDIAGRTKAINVIGQEVARLERIISDMLRISEIESGAMRLSLGEVRLAPLFADLESEFSLQAKEHDLALSFALPPKWPVVYADRDKVVLALHNLIGNALKYTPKGGEVSVAVETDDRTVSVSVRDTGIGIRPDEVDRVFERFYRAKDERVSGITGTGLGLPLAREVVRLHGGDITVRSVVNEGSTFTLTIPTRSQPSERSAA